MVAGQHQHPRGGGEGESTTNPAEEGRTFHSALWAVLLFLPSFSEGVQFPPSPIPLLLPFRPSLAEVMPCPLSGAASFSSLEVCCFPSSLSGEVVLLSISPTGSCHFSLLALLGGALLLGCVAFSPLFWVALHPFSSFFCLCPL